MIFQSFSLSIYLSILCDFLCRYTLASSLSSRVQEAKSSLSRVPILSSLTDEQLEKLSDTVAIITYNPGDVIITKGISGGRVIICVSIDE